MQELTWILCDHQQSKPHTHIYSPSIEYVILKNESQHKVLNFPKIHGCFVGGGELSLCGEQKWK